MQFDWSYLNLPTMLRKLDQGNYSLKIVRKFFLGFKIAYSRAKLLLTSDLAIKFSQHAKPHLSK